MGMNQIMDDLGGKIRTNKNHNTSQAMKEMGYESENKKRSTFRRKNPNDKVRGAMDNLIIT